jgi:hypothetical protein
MPDIITGRLEKVQGTYKLSEEFAKPNFQKYWTEMRVVTTVWKRNVWSFIVTLNAFYVRSTCDTADIQARHGANFRTHQLRSIGEAAISLQHWFTLLPRDGNSDYRTIPNITFTVCNWHEFYDLATLHIQVMAQQNPPIIYRHPVWLPQGKGYIFSLKSYKAVKQ